MSRLQFTRTRSDESSPSVVIPNCCGFSPHRDLSPDIVQRDFISRLVNDNSLSMEILGLESHELGVSDSMFERQFAGPVTRDLSLERKSPSSLIRPISISDGKSVRLVSEINGHGLDQSDSHSQRFHRHARDVSLAATGTRPQWHLAKSDPASSDTPPSHFMKPLDQSYHDFPALVDGRCYQHSNITETYFPEKRSNAIHETDFDSKYNSVMQYDETSQNSMQPSSYQKSLTSNEITDCFDGMQDIEEFFPDEFGQSRSSVVASDRSSTSTQSAESPVSLTVEHISSNSGQNCEEVIAADESPSISIINDNMQFAQNISFQSSSTPYGTSPFVKTERDAFPFNLTTSSRHLPGEELLRSDTDSLCNSKESSNSCIEHQREKQKIFRSPPPRIMSNFCPKEQKKRRIFCRKPPALISHNRRGRLNSDDANVTISRSALVKSDSLEIENLEQKLFSTYRSDRKKGSSSNHASVTISHEKRSSSMRDTMQTFDDCTNPSVQVDHLPATHAFGPVPFVYENNSVKYQAFQHAMKEVLAEVERTKARDLLERTTNESESCYESMKNFFKDAKPTTIHQMYSRATGNFMSLGQVKL